MAGIRRCVVCVLAPTPSATLAPRFRTLAGNALAAGAMAKKNAPPHPPRPTMFQRPVFDGPCAVLSCLLFAALISALAIPSAFAATDETSAAAPAPAAATPPSTPSPLEALREASRAHRSSALIVYENDALPVVDYDAAGAQPMQLASITKAIVGLGIGKLVAEGRIASIDDPVSKYLPEFKGGGREAITVRHVLEHSTGLKTERPFGLEVQQAYSALASAISAEPSGEPPGIGGQYDNRGMQLLCGVIRSVTREDVQDYMRREIFDPLGITRMEWARDRSGASYCHAGIAMMPMDLVKIGILVMARGQYADRRIIPERWFDLALPLKSDIEMHRPNGLWWQEIRPHPATERTVVDEAGLKRMIAHGLEPGMAQWLREHGHLGMSAFYDAFYALPPERIRNFRTARIAAMQAGMRQLPVRFTGDLNTIVTTGDGGQFLRIDLAQQRVVVRLIAFESARERSDTMADTFLPLTDALPLDAAKKKP
jgi:CubicO group peptidase (beta-lactamase class C family)